MGGWGRRLAWATGGVAIALAVLWLGTLVHESGHALVATGCGARVTEVNVLGLSLYPVVRLHYRPGFFGYVAFDRTLPHPQAEIVLIAGSLSTLAVALLAQGVLWSRWSRRTWARLALTGFSFSWLDVFWHTSRALLVPGRATVGEAYQGLLALGLPAWSAGAGVFGLSAVLLVLTVLRCGWGSEVCRGWRSWPARVRRGP